MARLRVSACERVREDIYRRRLRLRRGGCPVKCRGCEICGVKGARSEDVIIGIDVVRDFEKIVVSSYLL